MHKRRSAIGTMVAVLVLVAISFTMLAFVFNYLDKQAVALSNIEAPGSLATGDYYIFSQLTLFSAAIVALSMLLLVVDLSKRGTT